MIYKKIIEYCKKNNISISAFEKKCDIGNGTIGRWKDGSEPSLESLRKIAVVTNIPVKEWIAENDS